MVQRLLSKDPEDRYQSVQGISSDVAACLNHLEKQGRIPFFPIGQKDALSRFNITDTIYGRQKETGLLNEAFDKTLKGCPAFLLIKGYSGIGKTTLVRKFESELRTRQPCSSKVRFISGKFDILKQQEPYGALTQALKDLILTILTEDEKTIFAWRENITNELGKNVGLICGMIPEAEIVFGPGLPIRMLDPEETRNRFQLTITSFLRISCTQGRPLVLFLDDLQWADNDSLNLIRRVYDLAIAHFLFIGAFRDNEVDKRHPLSALICHLEQGDHAFEQVVVPPLTFKDVTGLIKESVNQGQRTAAGLAELLNRKTAGNPYYLKEYLNALYEDKQLVFSSG